MGLNETIEAFLPKVDLSVDSLNEGGWNVYEVMIVFRLLSLAGWLSTAWADGGLTWTFLPGSPSALFLPLHLKVIVGCPSLGH